MAAATESGDFPDLLVRFWGVRGSIACPGPRYMRYGGNTPCIEARAAGRLIIFDAGTGLRPLGEALVDEQPIDADVFLTHTHVDHIQGLPFFRPLFRSDNRFRFWAGHLPEGTTLKHVLAKYMATPLFPVPPEIFAAQVSYGQFHSGDTLTLAAGLLLRTTPLRHPQGSTGYRLDFRGRSFCYVTDTEHRDGERDGDILELIRGADLMIYDSTYTDEEYPAYRGWGHSTWQEGVRLADAGDVGRLVVFHHDPQHDDEAMDRIAAAAAAARPGTLVAREGLELAL